MDVLSPAFDKACNSDEVLNSTLRCATAHSMIMNSVNGNIGRRAGQICAALQQCAPSGPDCSVVLSSVIGDSSVQVNLQHLDKCTVEGIPVQNGGSYVPQVIESLELAGGGNCSTPSDCGEPEHYTCSTAPSQLLCQCNPVTGTDTCQKFGVCQKSSCGRCNDCVGSVAAITSQLSGMRDVNLIASTWFTNCTLVLKRNELQCEVVRQAILASTNGNVGMRPGSVCKLLLECDSSLVGTCDIGYAAQKGKLDACR